jgi:hypothetical protein
VTSFAGNLSNQDEVLGWLLHQLKSDEIEEITDEMLKNIIERKEHVAVVVCEWNCTKFQSQNVRLICILQPQITHAVMHI